MLSHSLLGDNCESGFTYPPPTRLDPYTNNGLEQTFTVLTKLITLYAELRNINPMSIGYAFRPRLRSRLTLPGRTVCRNPWAYGD